MPGSVCDVSDVQTPDPADDDAFRQLFRDEPAPTAAPEPTVEPTVEPAPVADLPATPSQSPVTTGRLFRSTRVSGDTEALPAVRSDQARHLRTLKVDASAEPTPAATLLVSSAPAPVVTPINEPDVEPAMSRAPKARGLNTLGVVVIIGGVTLVLGLLDAFIAGPGLGMLTGIGLVVATAFAALRVRHDDSAVCIITPPLAFFVAAITVGQIGQSSSGGLLGRAVLVFFMLADNWIWIIGATLVALAIVLVRGRQSR